MEAIFETNPVFLSSLLADLRTGKIQLPDFQRGWVWEDERIRGVLASVSRSFPIGALMMLETGGETKFHPRPVEGVKLQNGIEPDLLVLDGQQRLTSLFQATTYGKVVSTINRWRGAINVSSFTGEAWKGSHYRDGRHSINSPYFAKSAPRRRFRDFF